MKCARSAKMKGLPPTGGAPIPLTLAVAVLAFTGCGSYMGAHKSLRVSTHLSAAQRAEGLRAMAVVEKWEIATGARDAHEFVAFRSSSDDPYLRERITATLLGSQTVVLVQAEIYWDGSWSTARYQCSTYGYGREKEIAEAIEARELPASLRATNAGQPVVADLAKP